MQKSTDLSWDDLRFVVALARHGTLSRTARSLGVDHTTVGRRVEAAEKALGVSLFTRSQSGYALTVDGARLLPSMQEVALAVHAVSRRAQTSEGAIAGVIRVSAPESFGMTWLATQMALFSQRYPRVMVVLDPTGTLVDLGRGDAELALRTVRSTEQRLVVRRVAELGYGLYASPDYLAARPFDPVQGLQPHRLLSAPPALACPESRWLARLAPGQAPVLVSELSMALRIAARAHAGVAVLPRYLGDEDPLLVRLEVPEGPTEVLWLTVHEDARSIPRVRALLDFLGEAFAEQAPLLRGASGATTGAAEAP